MNPCKQAVIGPDHAFGIIVKKSESLCSYKTHFENKFASKTVSIHDFKSLFFFQKIIDRT